MSAEESVQPEVSTPMSLASAAGVALVFSLVGVLLVFIFGAWHWVETREFLAGGILVAAIVTLGIAFISKKAAHAIVALLVSAVCVAPLYAWEQTPVRTTVLRTAGGLIPAVTLRSALNDPNSDVGTEACLALLGRGYDEVKHTAREFADSPESTMLCLKDDVVGTDAEELLRRDVLWLWRESLAENQSPNCELVKPFVTLLPMVYDDSPSRLLDISLEAANDETRACLKAEFLALYPTPLKQLQALGNPTDVELKVREGLFGRLIEDSYSLEGDVNSREKPNPMIEQWMLSLGCGVLTETGDPGRIVRYLNTSMIAQGCGSVEEEAGSVSVWSEACIEAADPKTGFVTQHELCGRIKTHARNVAVEFARTRLWGGIEIMRWRALHSSVTAGHDRVAAHGESERFTPYDMMDDTISGSGHSVATRSSTAWGIGRARPYSAAATRHIRTGKVKPGVDRNMAEIFMQMAENDGFEFQDDEGKTVVVTDMRERLKAEGVDVKDLFSDKRKAEMELLLKQKKLDEEEELSVEDLIGEGPTKAEREAKERKDAELPDPAKPEG